MRPSAPTVVDEALLIVGQRVRAAPNLRWATHGAKIWTAEDGWVWLFDLVEHWNGKCRGWHVGKTGDRCAAWEPLAQSLDGVPHAARGIELRHDHGSQYLTDFFQVNVRCHGFATSFALLEGLIVFQMTAVVEVF